MRNVAIFLCLLSFAVAPLRATAEEDEKDPTRVFLLGVGKLIKGGDAGGISAYFKEKAKVELKLRGIQNGKYRDEQAKSLLATWFKRIEPKEVKLKEARDTVGKFETKYKVKADGTEVSGTVWVYFERAGEAWIITGIEES